MEKDIRNLKPLETREKEEKKKKRPTKAPVSPVPGNKKSERRIREEELEMEEAQREALEALKTGVEVERAEKKGPRVEDETKTVYSDKEKKKKGGLLGEKLGNFSRRSNPWSGSYGRLRRLFFRLEDPGTLILVRFPDLENGRYRLRLAYLSNHGMPVPESGRRTSRA